MLIEKRFREILEIVNKEKSVTVRELMEHLDASESTIRRDLNTLSQEGKLIKVHGGAVAVEGVYAGYDAQVRVRQELNVEDKEKIAGYAAGIIKDDDFVYLDAGTTTEKVIDYLTSSHTIFVTNSWIHAKKLSGKGYRAYILGGEFKSDTEAVVGEEALESLRKYNFTKGFFGTNGISRKEGFSTPDVREASVKGAAMSRCGDRYVLADHSKFSKISPVTFADFSGAKVITTGTVDAAYRECVNVLEV